MNLMEGTKSTLLFIAGDYQQKEPLLIMKNGVKRERAGLIPEKIHAEVAFSPVGQDGNDFLELFGGL